MKRIENIRRVNFKNIKYGKGLYELMPRARKKPQLEDNILTKTTVSIQENIKDVEVNYYSNSINMDSESREISIENRYTAWIL